MAPSLKSTVNDVPVVSSLAFLEFTGYAGGQKDENVLHYCDKARARREDVKGVGVVRDKELKLEDDEASYNTRWNGGRGGT